MDDKETRAEIEKLVGEGSCLPPAERSDVEEGRDESGRCSLSGAPFSLTAHKTYYGSSHVLVLSKSLLIFTWILF